MKATTLPAADYEKNPYYLRPGESVPDYNTRVSAFASKPPVADSAPPQQTPEQRAAAYAAVGQTPPPTGNPIVDSGIRRHITPDAGAGYAGAADKYFSGLDITPPTPGEQQQFKDQALRDVQAQLDGIDRTYATRLSAEVIRGAGRTGQGRAINARSGLLGSDMGGQRDQGIADVNKQAEDAILAERDNAKASVFDKAAQRAQDMFTLETNKAVTNAGQYLTFMKQKQDEARNDVTTLAKSGVAIDQLSDDEYKTLLNQSGYGSTFLFDAVYNSNLPVNQKKAFNYINAGNGVIVQVDPTGVTPPKNYDFSVPDGYTFKMAGDTPIFVNEKTQDIKVATPSNGSLGALAKETELDTFTNAQGKRISVMYNPVTKTTRQITLGDAAGGGGGAFPTGFKPQPFEVSAVSQFIAGEGAKQGQTPQQIQEAITKAQNDPTFFYSMLQTVVQDKAFSNLYYKPTSVGIPAAYQNDLSTPAGQ